MSAVNPNNNCGILIDEFIKMATEHLQTVEGAIFTLASYSPAGQILPSQVAWKGYFITPTQREIDLGQGFAIAELNTNYKAGEKKSLNPDIFAIAEDTGEQSETGVVYPNLNKADGTAIKNFGNTAQTNFTATMDDAKGIAETYMGQVFSNDQEWSNFVSLIAAESSTNQTEQAYVAAAILNRTRKRIRGAKTVNETIYSPGQFEPVTGPASSRVWYLRGPTPARETSIFGSIKQILPGVDKEIINFTSNDDCLYIRCTNGIPTKDANGKYINRPNRVYSYLLQLRANSSSVVIGGTIFSR
jgi:hypothetical protein